MVKVNVVPDHVDWKYELGEKVKFNVVVTKNRVPQENVTVWYEVAQDMMHPLLKDTIVLENGVLTLDAGTMKTPGFLRCRVWTKYDGRTVEGRATAAFEPEKIKPTAVFFCQTISILSGKVPNKENVRIPMNVKLRLLPERCTEKVNVYEWNVQNYRLNSRVYGILCVPVKPGKYPALLRVPGQGVRGYAGAIVEAEKGMITLEIGIHGIPVTLEPSVYASLEPGEDFYRYQYQNWDNRDEVYYKRVYMGCVRAVDYLLFYEEFDGSNLLVQGGSQGGALAIVTAVLNPRVTGVVSFFPALSDLSGYERTGRWMAAFIQRLHRCCRNQKEEIGSIFLL